MPLSRELTGALIWHRHSVSKSQQRTGTDVLQITICCQVSWFIIWFWSFNRNLPEEFLSECSYHECLPMLIWQRHSGIAPNANESIMMFFFSPLRDSFICHYRIVFFCHYRIHFLAIIGYFLAITGYFLAITGYFFWPLRDTFLAITGYFFWPLQDTFFGHYKILSLAITGYYFGH